MRKLVLTFISLYGFIITFAQAPQSFSYQAVVRDAQGIFYLTKMLLSVSALSKTTPMEPLFTKKHSKQLPTP